MKKALPWLLIVMGLGIVLLVLNLNEIDSYEFGTLTPPKPGNTVPEDDPAFQRIFPDRRFVHACPGCGECVHPLEIVENRRVMAIHDHDGWYKIFWAADEEYFYNDPVHMIADWGKNRTAEDPRGTWTIRLRAGRATHGRAAAHDCGQIPLEIELTYELVHGEAPLDETFHSGDGPLKIPKTFSWLVSDPGRPVSLGWRLAGEPRVTAGPCSCAKP